VSGWKLLPSLCGEKANVRINEGAMRIRRFSSKPSSDIASFICLKKKKNLKFSLACIFFLFINTIFI